MDTSELSDRQYGLLFDVRRAIRYHDCRRAFYELLHHLTSGLTILMAGSVLFDLGKPGDTAPWLQCLSTVAALFAAADMVLGYSRRATAHADLRRRFADLEIAMLDGDLSEAVWKSYERTRLSIEKDEPPVYKIVDLQCHNELLVAYGKKRSEDPSQFATFSWWQACTKHFWRWEDWQPRDQSVR